ncbi:unnamed protein product [Larinioides sclopetarius]|uniref:Uncharacterized protein n=1 Tax=Larinioides sclopetarius TaxID=280406 RepID=A0AAV1ZZR6_9ARAC
MSISVCKCCTRHLTTVGNVMVWDRFRQIQEISEKFLHEDIHKNSRRPYTSSSLSYNYIFQHYNDPKHRFSHHHVALLDSSSLSPNRRGMAEKTPGLNRRNARNADEKLSQN